MFNRCAQSIYIIWLPGVYFPTRKLIAFHASIYHIIFKWVSNIGVCVCVRVDKVVSHQNVRLQEELLKINMCKRTRFHNEYLCETFQWAINFAKCDFSMNIFRKSHLVTLVISSQIKPHTPHICWPPTQENYYLHSTTTTAPKQICFKCKYLQVYLLTARISICKFEV